MVQDIFKPYKINYSELENYEMVKGNIFFVMDQKAIYLDLDNERRVKITPTKVSEIENDSHFIDKTVNDLTNYYTKDEIDTLKLILLGAIDTKISFEDIPELFQKLEYGGHVASVADLPPIVLDSRLVPGGEVDSSTYTISNLQEGINDLNQNRNVNSAWRNRWIKAKKEEISAAFNLGVYGADYRNWLSSAWVGNFGDPEWGITFIYKNANTTVKFFLFNGTSNYGDDVTIPVYLAPTDSFIELQLVDCGWRVYNADTGANTLYKYDEEEENDYITIFSGDEDLYIYPDIYDSSISAENIDFLNIDTGWDHPPYTGTAICGTTGGKLTLYKETSCPAEVRLFIQNNSDYIFGHWLNKIALPEFDVYEGDPCILKNGAFLKIDNTGIMTYNFLSDKIGTSDLLYTVGSNADIYYISKYDFEYKPWSQISSASIIAALGYTPADAATLGQPNGIATLDNAGKVPATQLPAFVDDVLEFANRAAFPETGESGKIYVALDTNLTYRWSGSTYVEISQSLALGETETTAYRGDRGKIGYDHASDANKLTTAKTSDLYKISTTTEGHIAGATAMTQADFNTDYDIKPTVFVTLAKTNKQSSHTKAEILALVAANYEVIGKWEYTTNHYYYLPLLVADSSLVLFGAIQPQGAPSLGSYITRSVLITIPNSGNTYTQSTQSHGLEAIKVELILDTIDSTKFRVTTYTPSMGAFSTFYTYTMSTFSHLYYNKIDTSTGSNLIDSFMAYYGKGHLDGSGDDINSYVDYYYIGNLRLDDEIADGIYKYIFKIDGASYPYGTISKVRLDSPEYIKTKTFNTTYIVPYNYPSSVTATNSTCLFDDIESNTSESGYAWIGENQRLVIPYGASFDPTNSSNYGSTVSGSHRSITGPILVSFYYLYSDDGTYTTNSRFLYLKSGKVQQYEDTEDIGYYTQVNNDIRTDVQVNGTSIVSNNVANLITNTAYDSTSNKLATMADIQSQGVGNSKVWYGTSSTSATTQIKVVDCTGFTLETGATLIVKFTYAQGYLLGAPQLNVNNTGAVDVYWNNNSYGERYQWGAGAVIQFIYDGTKWIMEGRNPASSSDYGLVKLYDGIDSSLTDRAATARSVKTAYDLAYAKQDALVSGTNIKTVNNQSVLGSGNLDIAVSPEIAISTTQPTGDEVLWINPNEVPTGGSGGGSEPDVFSMTETLTNKIWIDGKPIYRKCFEYNVADIILATDNEIDITSLGADIVFIDYNHSYLRYPAEEGYPVGYTKLEYYASTRDKCSLDIDNLKIYIHVATVATFVAAFDKIFIVLEYTKASSSL